MSNHTANQRSSRRLLLAAALGALSVLTVGCATKPPPAPVVSGEDPVARRLRESIVAASAGPAYTRNAEGQAPAMVAGPNMTVDYQGEAAALLRRVAQTSGYQFRQSGPQPYVPLVVHVDVADKPFVEFLKDIGSQFAGRADLVLSDKTIEIRYRGASVGPYSSK